MKKCKKGISKFCYDVIIKNAVGVSDGNREQKALFKN